MNKFKKIILTIVCIVSAFVLASAPAFASTYQFNYARQVGDCQFPSQLQVMTMGYQTNVSKNLYIPGVKTQSDYVSFELKPSRELKDGQDPRLQLHFFYNSAVPTPHYVWNGSEWVEKLGIASADLNTFNNYSSRDSGMLDITFRIYQPGTWLNHNYSLYGFQLRSAIPDFSKAEPDTNNIYVKPTDFYISNYPENVTITGPFKGTYAYFDGDTAKTRAGSYCTFRVIVPLTSRLTDFVITFKTTPFVDGCYIRDLNMTYYSNPFQLPNYNYDPDIDSVTDLNLLEQSLISDSKTGTDLFIDMLSGVSDILSTTNFMGKSLLACSEIISSFMEITFFYDFLRLSLLIGAFAFVVNIVPSITHSRFDNDNNKKSK